MRVPAVRFPDFDESWDTKKLGEILDISSAARVHKDEWQSSGVPFFRTSDVVAAYKGQNNEKAFISAALYELLSTASGKVQKDDLLITGGGSIGIPYIIEDDSPIYFKDADLLWFKSAGKVSSTFLFAFYESPTLRKYLKSISHIGTIAHYTIEQSKATPIGLPSLPEQQKIGEFFENLDSLINVHQKELQKLRQFKSAMLGKMFPKSGAVVPEVRFPGFAGEWEGRELGTIATFSKGSGYSKNDLTDHGAPIILYGRLYTRYKSLISEVDTYAEMQTGSRLSVGNEVIIPASGETSEDIARASAVLQSGVILAGDLNIVHPSKRLQSHFLALHLSSGEPHRKLAERAQGKSVVHLHSKDFADVSVKFPSLPEQQKIGEFFENLDSLIDLQVKKGEKLSQVKRSLLSKMFV